MSTSSYHDAATCYTNNNNIDDAATYNDYLRGRRSPGINSDVLDTSTTLRALEDAEAHFPTSTPRLSADTTGGPPILEDGSRRLGGRLPVQGVHTTGAEEGVVGKSAGNTPHPNAAILFGDSDGKDNDIQCGQCENPLDYCHCDNTDILFIPPPIIAAINTIITTTQDGEETALSAAEEEEDNSPPVEVRVGRGLHSPTDTQRGVQEHRSRMYAPGTPQRQAHHTLSPTPNGFVHNQGLNYVPFCIPTTNGRGVTPAKYVMVHMGINPMVAGCMYKGGVVYQGDIHAAPSHNHGDCVPDYTHEQLCHFCSDYMRRDEVNEVLEHIGDKSLLAEVSCFHGTMDAMKRLQDEIREREDKLYCHGNDNRKCVHRLERAHTLGRVFEEEEIANGLRVIMPWALERQRQRAEEW
jgi:hypothetical protein